MFDIGFSELLLLAFIALIVVGPERLPTALRKAGLWINRVNKAMQAVRNNIARELHNEEIKQAIATNHLGDRHTKKDDK